MKRSAASNKKANPKTKKVFKLFFVSISEGFLGGCMDQRFCHHNSIQADKTFSRGVQNETEPKNKRGLIS